jgi:hypothetical protein
MTLKTDSVILYATCEGTPAARFTDVELARTHAITLRRSAR